MDTFEKIAAIISVLNAKHGDRVTLPPIVLLNKKGTTNNGRKIGKKHQLNGKVLIRELTKKRKKLTDGTGYQISQTVHGTHLRKTLRSSI